MARRKRKTYKHKKISSGYNKNLKLLLVDHDGTLCDTNPLAYDSMKYAFNTVVDILGINLREDIDWDKVFADTRGTTEKNLIRYLSYYCGIHFDKVKQLESKFYHFRAKWYENMRSCNEYIWDTYYPDAHQLVFECAKSNSYELWLLTGNPEVVLEERLSNSIKEIFSKNGKLQGVFGDLFYSREEVIEAALEKAKIEFGENIVDKDSIGFHKNVYYVADSRSDFFAGIEAKVRTVWIPSRSLQDVIEKKDEDYVRFIENTLGDRVLIVNDLFSDEVKKFVGLGTV
jgi:phosphoglycolate phosphatase-like HAD superfamily hydrolase